MRAVLLNDTRSEEYHFGCKLVVQNILAQCHSVGFDVVDTIAHSASNDIAYAQRGEFDLLLINGEGTMHHDRPKAVSLMRAAMVASQRGKLVALINTVWQQNRVLNDLLAHVDLVFCREPLSHESLHAAGCAAQIVPDMVFATDIAGMEFPLQRTGTAVVDSVDHDTMLRLARLAVRRGFDFLPMHRATCMRLRRRKWLSLCLRVRTSRPIQQPETNFFRDLSRYESIISGRFHAACLAFMLGIPVVCMSSNTHKIEGLVRAAGLDSRAIVANTDPRQLKRSLDYVRSRTSQDLVAQYVNEAPGRIQQMFQQIRDASLNKAAA